MPKATRSWTLGEIAEKIEGRVLGDDSVRIGGIRPLADAGPEDLSFLHVGTYWQAAVASQAAALLLAESLADKAPELGRPVIIAPSSQLALARAVELFYPTHRPSPGRHETAVVGDGCEIHPTVHLGAYAVIGDGTVIEAHSIVEAHAVIGRSCRIGSGCRVHPGVVIYDECELGHRVEIHSGSVIGADGFGYASVGGVHHKIPQVGTVTLDDDVEVGAISAVDRALLERTYIGPGTKIDNHVQVGHNVQTGKGCLLCGQVGIAGSAELGDYVVLAGQVGVTDHSQVGTGVQVAAKSLIYSGLESGIQAGGIPAVELRTFHRRSAATARLPDLLKRVRSLEKQLEKLKSSEDPVDR